MFALAERHSEVLDDILGACLLRSSQKAAGEVLRGILDTVLKFGILMSDLAAHRVQEYEAAAPLEDLYELFRRRCIALVSSVFFNVKLRTCTDGIAGESVEGLDRC